jgi:glycyl-tRNA synthetase
MRKHQRYFPVCAPQSDALLPAFVTVANGPVDQPTVRAGNEAVLRARFEDAQFFYRADGQRTLEDVRPRLAGTMFQKELGSMLDKCNRIEAMIKPLASATGLESAITTASDAARLCRADLAMSVVTEMTELAGIMGRHYALREGQSPEVAQAIFESVLPRFAGDELPSSAAGTLVALSDKLDSLVGLYAAGCAPTASADPYGLRRAAVGLLQALIHSNARVNLREAVDVAAAVQPIEVSSETVAAVLEFIERRLEQMLVDGGVPVEAVRSALAERGHDPALASRTAHELGEELSKGEAGRLFQVMTAMARPVRLTRGKDIAPEWAADEALMGCEEERALLMAYRDAANHVGPKSTVNEFLVAAGNLIMPLDAYFDKVFVMCEDEGKRRGRLALLRDVAALQKGILDLAELPGF